MIPKFSLLALGAGSAVLLCACGTPANRPAMPTAGIVVAQRGGDGARVCVDLNDNARCDPGEPSTVADSAGRFQLQGDGRSAWIAELAEDPSAAQTRHLVLRALPGEGQLLSPISSLLAAQVRAGVPRAEALERIALRVGVRVDQVSGDPRQQADLIARELLALQGLGFLDIQRAARTAGHTQSEVLNRAAPVIEPGLYAWSQFASDARPFSASVVQSVQADGVPGSLTDETPISGFPARRTPAEAADLRARYTVTDPTVSIGHQVVRAITPAKVCPVLIVDGVERAMRLRAPAARGIDANAASETGDSEHPMKANFDVLTCEAPLPAGALSASINGQALKPLDASKPVNRVVVVGDTGCRVMGPTAFGSGPRSGGPLQDCSEASAWPWPRLARVAASFAPDLVIHNGDIHYREGTPKGTEPGKTLPNEAVYGKFADTITYGWKAWEADFFRPAGPLLAAAPWAITRGNHELCDRAGAGWFRFLDARSFPEAEPRYSPRYDAENCSNYTDPMAVRLGDLQLLLLDVGALADAPGRGKSQGWTNGDHLRTARQLSALSRLPSTQSATISWLVAHKPLLAYYAGGKQASSSNWQFQKAIQPGPEDFLAGNGALPENLQMIHSGHIHGWQMVSHPEETGLPTQYLVGVSGQALEGLIQGGASASPYMPLAPETEGHDIPAGDKRWPWHKAPWWFTLADGRMAMPDAFSTSPVVDAGKPTARTEEFAIMVFDRIPGTSNWMARMYDPQRRLLRTCTTTGKRSRCDG